MPTSQRRFCVTVFEYYFRLCILGAITVDDDTDPAAIYSSRRRFAMRPNPLGILLTSPPHLTKRTITSEAIFSSDAARLLCSSIAQYCTVVWERERRGASERGNRHARVGYYLVLYAFCYVTKVQYFGRGHVFTVSLPYRKGQYRTIYDYTVGFGQLTPVPPRSIFIICLNLGQGFRFTSHMYRWSE